MSISHHRGSRTAYACLLSLALLSAAAWLLPHALSGGSASAADSTFVRRIRVPANDLVYDGVSKRLYASVPSSAGAGGNSITPVDPATGAVGTPVFVGSEPGRLALSDDGKYLYTYLEGAAAVRRFDLTTQTPGLRFALRTSPAGSPYTPTDFAVLPGKPESIAVVGSNTVAVYDDDVRRPTAVTSVFSSPYVEFGTAADTLYGVGSNSSVLYRFSVAAAGVTTASTTSIGGYGDFRVAGGRIYLPTGQVYDASSGALQGTFPDLTNYSAAVLPDPATGRAYFVLPTGGINPTVTLRAYDINTFLLLGSAVIPVNGTSVASLVRWGANGLAFRTRLGFSTTPDAEFYVVQTTLVPSGETVPTPTPTPTPTSTPTATPTPVTFTRQLSLPANDLAYDPTRQKLYASMPSTAGDAGNTVAVIDPATGALDSATFVGSEPNKMALTDDGQYLYVGLDGAAAMRRIDLTTGTPGLQFPLGASNFDGPYYARDLAPLAGQPDLVAVTRGVQNFFSRNVAVYDAGVQRASVVPSGEYLEPSAQSSTLYSSNSSSDYQKLSVSSGGVTTSSSIYAGGTGGDFRVVGETLYTQFGRVVDPATNTLKGTFTGLSSGSWSPLVVPDPDHGRVFFLMYGGLNAATLRAYDINTFLPLGSVQITGIAGTPSGLVRWGADGLAFRTSGGYSPNSATNVPGKVFLVQSALVSDSSPAAPPPVPTPTATPTPVTPAVEVEQVSLATNDLIYEPTRKLLYVSVPGNAGASGNTVAAIDPTNQTVGTPVFVGSEPKKLALTDDGQYLYVGLDGAGAVRRIDLTTGTPGLQFSLGNSPSSGPYRAFDLAVPPGSPGSVAVTRLTSGGVGGGVTLYDEDVQRPNAATAGPPAFIEFGAAADTIYSSSNSFGSTNFLKYSVNSQGTTYAGGTPAGTSGDFRIANGRAYMPSGQVIDIATGNLVGKFQGMTAFNSLVAPDPANGRVYFLIGADSYSGFSTVTLTLKAFDIDTFRLLGSVQVPGVVSAPTSLVRWGANGLAFRTGPNTSGGTGNPPGNRVFLVRTSLVPSNETIPTKTRFTLASYTVNEYGTNAVIGVTRSGDTSAPATVNYSTSNGTATAGSDYNAVSGTLTFGAGETAKSFNIPVLNDTLYEGTSETVNITLSNPAGAALGAPSTSTLTIYDDDPSPYITVGSPTITEADAGTTDATFSLFLSNPTVHNVTVNYATANGTATAGSDYVAASGTLTIPAGSTVGSFTVKINGDYAIEPDESFYVNYSNAANAYLLSPQVFAFIRNNDAAGSFSFHASPYSVGEDAGFLAVTVNRLGGAGAGVSVNYATLDGTAKAGQDYASASGTLTFAGGETSKTFNLHITDDAAAEADESFSLLLSGATGGAMLGFPSSATVTIRNNDSPGTFAFGAFSYAADEGGGSVAVTVSRSGGTSDGVSVNYATTEETARGGQDFAPTAGTLTFGAGETSKTFSVPIVNDTLAEPDETFIVALGSPTGGATIGAHPAVSVNIKDDDQPLLQFAAANYGVAEGGGQIVLKVVRVGDASGAAAVAYSTADGTATEMSDYGLTLGTLRFGPGETEKTVVVMVNDDALTEPAETFIVTLGAASGAAVTTPATATVTIAGEEEASAANPLDGSRFFVRQHYHDFFSREPDEDGLNFWTNDIESCGADKACRDVKRINVSAAFFLSIEFQQTGYLVYRLNQAAFGTGERQPWRQFLADTQEIGRGVRVGIGDWQTQLEANKQAFVSQFVTRPEFALSLQVMSAAQYVDTLNANTLDPLAPGLGGALTQQERDALVSDLGQGRKTRAEVLRAVADNPEFVRRQSNRAFVLMQYFGYLRRNPNDAPDRNFDGYNFWLGKLDEFGGNFQNAEMVKAFLESIEYRNRFGQ